MLKINSYKNYKLKMASIQIFGPVANSVEKDSSII
jgi:hypothetical protein